VVADGSTTPIAANVASIGLLPVAGSASSYPVTVAMPGTGDLPNGSTAQVSVRVGSSGAAALLVPASALTAAGPRYTVRVVAGNQVTTTPVEVGAIGTEYAEILHGLSAGQQVIVAQVDEPLPTGNTGFRGFGSGAGGGGFGGGGAGGGFGGGGAGGGFGGGAGGGGRTGRG
jgi:HlyD family secretion protein